MAHHVYQTDAFILKGIDIGDSNRFVDVFTRDMGLVRAAARSARYEKSKLRYSLQNYTYSDVSLVRGREIWRITGASEKHSLYYKFEKDESKMFLCAQIFSLLGRFLHGEEKNEYLFDTVISFLDFLGSRDFSEKELKNLECLVVLRILYTLGYVANNKYFTDLLSSIEFNDILLTGIGDIKERAVKEINRALSVSHL